MMQALKWQVVALPILFVTMNPVWAADAFADSVPVPHLVMATRTGLTVAMTDLQRRAFSDIDLNESSAVSAKSRDSDRVPQTPQHGTWMTLLAAIGLIGVLIGRAKRRYT